MDNARESIGIFEQPHHDRTQEYAIEQTASCADQQTQTPIVKVASTESQTLKNLFSTDQQQLISEILLCWKSSQSDNAQLR